ncbi:DUF5683 domain-containing protein [Robertkochia sediminum]|uniref:DUF5683 domain-containing protein n=1 Tax=Robertkochia sediminum TaxID=2785326 RepID=UPI0019322D12|nr:DUF5683 domain-containing protein [Robertkochia sediminum]MBL7472169.1 hypothetical protein [Robertkochia sediminum]
MWVGVFHANAQEIPAPLEPADSLQLSQTQQEGALTAKEIRRIERKLEKQNKRLARQKDPLTPARAAFYSAMIPGLGQIYNRSYWKLPIVYGAIGTGMYFYINNSNQYNRYRDAYKSRLAGFQNDEFYDINGSGIIPGSPDVSDESLRNAQEFYQRNRDLSLLITVGLYVLNIIDANVDAHLKQYNISDDLTFQPYLEQNPNSLDANFGLSLNMRF